MRCDDDRQLGEKPHDEAHRSHERYDQFLACNPFEHSATLAQRLVNVWKAHGITQKNTFGSGESILACRNPIWPKCSGFAAIPCRSGSVTKPGLGRNSGARSKSLKMRWVRLEICWIPLLKMPGAPLGDALRKVSGEHGGREESGEQWETHERAKMQIASKLSQNIRISPPKNPTGK